jgi:hypothetical protein
VQKTEATRARLIRRGRKLLVAAVLVGAMTVGNSLVATPASAGTISVDQFYSATVGKTVANVAGTYAGECVSLVSQYLQQVHGVTTGRWGNAVDYRAGGSGGGHLQAAGFSWSTDQSFQNGDILVWGQSASSGTGSAGHIAIWYNGRLFDQNDGRHSPKPTRESWPSPFFGGGYLGHWRKGPPPGSAQPFGNFDAVASVPGGVEVRGWAIDPDTNDPIGVHVYVDGAYRAAVTADVTRQDVEDAFHRGANHGFSVFLPGYDGGGSVTVYAINAGGGNNPSLGTIATPPSATPVGALEAVIGQDGAVRLQGWASDPDYDGPVAVHVYRDGVHIATANADVVRDDRGDSHGFDVTVPQGESSTEVYHVFAINYGKGPHPEFGWSASPPRATTPPSMMGTSEVGAGLTIDPGSWDPTDTATTVQWFSNSEALPEATTWSYTPKPDDLGKELSATVTASSTDRPSATFRVTAGSGVAPGTLAAPAPTIRGAQKITGIVRASTTLTAVPGEWGPSPVDLSYQWFAAGTPIEGATERSLPLTNDQIGSAITVSVTGTKDGYSAVTATSEPTSAVLMDVLEQAPATITGRPEVGATLTAVPGTWGPGSVSFSYQWLASGIEIPGATASTHVIDAAQLGATFTVRITGAKEFYEPATQQSAPTAAAAPGVFATKKPTIAGTAEVGATLTAKVGTWAPQPETLGYQWSVNGIPVSGASAATFTVPASAVGKSVTVEVSGSRTAYSPIAVTSKQTGPVKAATLTAGVPVVSGTPRVGVALTAAPGSWGPQPVSFSYAWKAGGVSIAGATTSSYTLRPADVGKSITVTVTAVKKGFATRTAQSAPSAKVAPGALTTATPVITGKITVGSTLTVRTGTWGPAPIALAYQWASNGRAIPRATSKTYRLTIADAGKTITVSVTGTRSGYATSTKRSARTASVTGLPLIAPTPTIAGQARVGSKLTVSTGAWKPSLVALRYSWASGGTTIPGATAAQYTPTAADRGKTITVTVTGTKAGYTSASRISTATKRVVAGSLSASTPTISGIPQVGSALTARPGEWGPSPVTLTYQWYSNDRAIVGATKWTFTPTAALRGTTISLRVTGARAGYATSSRTSTAAATVRAGTLVSPIPTTSGTAQVGSTITANPGSWGPAPVTLTYQWYAAGKPITNGTGRSYRPTASTVGMSITVRVTGTKTGYAPVSKISRGTRPVIR